MEITFCKEKLEKIQQQMQLSGADACLLCVDVNLYYLTGRIYNGYFYVPAEGKPYFFVKRPAGFSGENVYYIRKPEDITDILSAAAMELPEYLWLETDVLSYNESIRLEKIFRPARLGDAGKLMRNIRKVKTAEEIEQFRISAQRHVEVYKEVRECFRMGMTDLQLQYEIEYRMRKMDRWGFSGLTDRIWMYLWAACLPGKMRKHLLLLILLWADGENILFIRLELAGWF